MVALIATIVAWIGIGAFAYWWYEIRYYKQRMMERPQCNSDLISLNRAQRNLLYALWPVAVFGYLFLMGVIFFVRGIDIVDEKVKSKRKK